MIHDEILNYGNNVIQNEIKVFEGGTDRGDNGSIIVKDYYILKKSTACGERKVNFKNANEIKLIFICNYIENHINKTNFKKFSSCEINLNYSFQLPYLNFILIKLYNLIDFHDKFNINKIAELNTCWK